MRSIGQKWVAKHFVVQVKPNENLGKRFGLTVTKKLEKSAAKRNRMKRRLRSLCFDLLPEYAADHHDYILIARDGLALKPYEALKKDFLWCLKKLEKRVDNAH